MVEQFPWQTICTHPFGWERDEGCRRSPIRPFYPSQHHKNNLKIEGRPFMEHAYPLHEAHINLCVPELVSFRVFAEGITGQQKRCQRRTVYKSFHSEQESKAIGDHGCSGEWKWRATGHQGQKRKHMNDRDCKGCGRCIICVGYRGV